MKATKPTTLAMASTRAGMRRILSKRLSPDEYIRKAVVAGVYPGSSTEDQPRNTKMLKQRRNPRTGAYVFEFPKEYEIMKLNIVWRDETRLTKKDLKKMRKWEQKKKNGEDNESSMEDLIKAYMRRNASSNQGQNFYKNSDDYYANLLGVQPPHAASSTSTSSNNTAMSNKSALLDNAYKFALKQYEVMKSSSSGSDKNMSEAESVQMVEDILRQEQMEEKVQSRKVTEEITDWRKVMKKEEETSAAEAAEGEEEIKEGAKEATPAPKVGLPSILHSKPQTITALTTWSKRLALLPYHQWSVGAVTALDHWIALDVLGLEEDSWQLILEGQVKDSGLYRDIVSVRSALFPETVVGGEEEEEEEEEEGDLVMDGEEAKKKKKKEVEQSIDELLASLGGFDEEEEEEKEQGNKSSALAADGENNQDGESIVNNEELVEQMKVDLQQWRTKVEEDGEYESWEEDKKKEFDAWLEQYVRLLTNEEWELQHVDYNATRQSLLSLPSTTREESDEYWNNLRDETQAEIFLQSVLEAHENNKDGDDDTASFLSLPYDTQLKRLIHLGTLRPLYDEYMTESSKLQFIQENIHTLLENVYLEHLVLDAKGPIGVDDFGSEMLQSMRNQVRREDRFRIEMVKYGTDEYGTSRAERARALYRAWNEHKASRARYEEAMFKKGKIGLKARKKE